ncbi:MAG: VWA domain-containing protein [Deltaproteobacteria bacterium]|nr:VWA domain-containing protein [Deltaproteobacteria bacterium]
MRQLSLFSFVGLAALLAGCPDRTVSKVVPDQGRVEYKDIPVTVNRNIDILFVVDDSGSMADKQANLKANFGGFINVLNTIDGGLPDVHIGVISSDMGTKGVDGAPGPGVGTVGQGGCANTGDDGKLLTSGASLSAGSTFISDIKQTDGTRLKNYTGALDAVFGQMASLGATGCGFEQHLWSMQRSLQNTTANPGFLRPDAFLAVIFLADEDDCSMQTPSLLAAGDTGPLGPLTSFRCTRFGVSCAVGGTTTDQMNVVGVKDQCAPNDNSQYLAKVSAFVTYLKGLKTDPSKVIVAGIMGTTEPFAIEQRQINGMNQVALAHSCTYASPTGTQFGDPPTRLKFFLDQFPNRSTFTTICQADLSGGMQQIAQLLKTALGNPCIEGKLAMPIDCSVSDVANYLKPNQSEVVLPRCNNEAPMTPSNTPCWRISKDPAKCPTGDQFILDIQRGGTTPPPDTHVIAYCVTEA